MSISRLTPASTTTQPLSRGGRPPSRPHQAVLPNVYEEPERPTPCFYDPERWHPDAQLPDPEAMAACWSCFFQSRCALKALATDAEFGIWAGYRLAPGPGLKRSRAQLEIIAGMKMGPPMSPGRETDEVLAANHRRETRRSEPQEVTPAAPPEQDTTTPDISADDTGDETSAVIPLGDRLAPPRQCMSSSLQLALALHGQRSCAHAG
ncbi:WhiB family transcriptional regulator [Candidatus Mycobacterium methanotrophicum]|nr:WhiB family transcriptional regulator [Candidatus Mycobacterium methanotrophicum]